MQFDGLNAEQIFDKINEGKPLNTKKNILEYIDLVKKLSKEELGENQVKASYQFIEKNIQDMSESVKPNTIVFLKNELRNKLGKFASVSNNTENAFLKFFKETYPATKRNREYTWVLADLNRIKEQQILDTLKAINTYCFTSKLSQEEKKDIFPMIERIVDTQNLRLINQIRSMEGIRKAFRIRVTEDKGRLVITKIKR